MPVYTPCIAYMNIIRHNNPCGLTNDFTALPHHSYSFAYILSGGADFCSDSGCVTVGADEIVFIPRGARYTSHWHGAPESRFITCYFDPGADFGAFCGKRFEIQRICGLCGFREELEKIADGREGELEALSALHKMLARLLNRLEYTELGAADERISAAAEYIRANPALKITVPELARIANMSVPHFQRCFKREVGCSPICYKNELAISRAAQMLLERRDMPIEAVSFENGFESPIYFRRLFKRRTGKTPGEYRKAMKGSV